MRQDGMKVKAAVVVLAALLAVLCVFMLCGPLNSPLYGSTTGTPGHFATQTVPGLRLHAKIHPRPPPNVTFDPGGRDSLVFIHIPKTGGSDFLRHLVTVMRENLTLCLPEPASLSVTPESGRENRNKKKKKDKTVCLRPNSSENDSLPKSSSGPWLISEKTLGWYCGLHTVDYIHSTPNTSLVYPLKTLWQRRDKGLIQLLPFTIPPCSVTQSSGTSASTFTCRGAPLSATDMCVVEKE